MHVKKQFESESHSCVFRYPVSLHVVGYITSVINYAQHVYDICRLTVSKKMSECAAPHNHFAAGYSRNHTVIKTELYL